MTRHFADWEERTLDLAIDRYSVGLGTRDETLLKSLAKDSDLRDFENTMAAIHLSGLVEVEAPPAEFLRRLEREGRMQVENGGHSPELKHARVTAPPYRGLALVGWLVAAGLALIFFLPRQASESDAIALRAELIASAGDLVRLDWTASEDPSAAGAGGDVVWSSSFQEGYMRFRSLAPNDPEQSQYQLWIFDPTRANWEEKPVDGGVFDVLSTGEVVVPIDAKLAVNETALFAVTIEVSGGVVVSERERLVLTAAL
ncbi:MAG: hypothetical protein ACI8X5_002505 [Planctomycetota bacterium]|jgi:hypothetical protein